jgi:RHS repeat-associated protein
MTLRALRGTASGTNGQAGRAPARRLARRSRRLVALALSPVLATGTSLTPVVVVAAGAAAATVVSAAVAAAPARAASPCSGPVLVFPDSVNGGSSSAEAAEAAALGCSVTMFSSSAVSGMTQAQMEGYFGGFSAIIIGDPSTSTTCSATVPADALQYAPDWGPAVKGSVAVLGTAPVLAGSAGKTLLDDAITYAVTGGTSGNTGLYASLNCDYSTAAAGIAVPLLASVGGGGFTVTGQASHCPDTGTVNPWQVLADAPFSGLTSANLGTWSSPACSVEETLTAFTAGLSGLAYDAAATPATFTASTGATGEAYVLAGTLPTLGTLDLAPSQGGEVPAGTTTGGANPAAAAVSDPTAGDPVNAEDGDFTQSDTDLSIPTYGPPLPFTRSYDSDAAQQQTQTGQPGALGYGWTDNWATSLTPGRPVQGDIYTLDGLRASVGGDAPTAQPVQGPGGVLVSGGNTYIADSQENRVEEIAGSSGTQWGIPMTVGDMYTIAGSPTGTAGESASGTKNTSFLLDQPYGLAVDSAGDLFIADSANDRVLELAASTTPWGAGSDGIPSAATADDLYVVAGTGTAGVGADSKAAYQSALNQPMGVAIGGNAGGSLYVADTGNNRIQMISQVSTTHWGISMPTAYDVYTVAGSPAGTAGDSGNGTVNSSSLLDGPQAMVIDSSGNLYIPDTLNNRVTEIPKATGAQWGDGTMTLNDLYTVAGSATGAAGTAGDGGIASSALLDGPRQVTWASPNLYITDSLNNRVQEIAGSGHTEFGLPMTADDIYTVAGTGTAGYNGDGEAATAAQLNDPVSLTLDGSGNLYLTDVNNDRVRKVSASTADISTFAGNGLTLSTNGDDGPATLAALNDPMQEAFDSHGDTYIADAANNRIQEIAAYNHSQYGLPMTAGDVYTIAGEADGQPGCTCDGAPAYYAYLDHPDGIAIDSAGDLYIADSGNNRIQEVPNSSGIQWGQNMSLGDMYTIAGNQYAESGYSGDDGPAGQALLGDPIALTMDPAGDIYIADSWNNRVQEIYAAGGENWGNSGWTAGDIYTIAGSPTGAHGSSGDGYPAEGGTSPSLLYGVGGLALDSSGNLYIGDGGNNRVQELAASNHSQWGQPMTAADVYTITGGYGTAGDGGPALDAQIIGAPSLAIDAAGDLYIADEQNNRIQEIANVTGTQWGQSMTAGDMYTVAGSATGASGNSGDGGLATAAKMSDTESISLDPEGDLYITDNSNDTVREVASAIPAAIPPAPNQTSSLAIAPSGAAPGGLTITQPNGSQVTFWAQTAGSCAPQYDMDGSYCVLPQDQSATLTDNSGAYTFSPDPGDTSYTYTSVNGQLAYDLASETDAAGNKITVTNNSPAPGGTVSGNGTCPSSATSCQTIASVSGRALVLGWNGANDTGQVTSVTDPMNRTWTYGYSSGDLHSATDPMTNVTSYTYGAGTSGNPLLANDLLTITKPNAQSGGPDAGDDTVNVYNAAGQVTQQTDPMGWKTTFNYCVNANAGNCMNATTGTGFVTVTDPDLNSTLYYYVQGALASQTVLTGTTVTSTSEDFPDTTAASISNPSGGTLQDTSTTDGDGNTTTTAYNADGNPTTSTAPGPNGTPATTTSAYTSLLQDEDCTATAEASSTDTCNDGASPPPAVAPGGVITPPSSPPPFGVTYILNDTYGNQLYTTTGVYSPSGTYEYAKTTYQLFKGNTITLNSTNISCTYTPLSSALPCATINADGVVTQLEYDSQGDLTCSSTPDGNSGGQVAAVTATYNADGEQLTKVAPDGNVSCGVPGSTAGNSTTTTAWNADGDQASVTQGNGSGYTDTPRPTSYGYDGDGNQTTVKDARGYTTTTTFNADDEPTLVSDPDSNATLTCYDGDGNVAQTVPPTGVKADGLTPASCPAAYPADYNPATKAPLASDATMSTYDSAGNKTATYSPLPTGASSPNPWVTTSYTYDQDGNLITTTAPPATNGGSNQVTISTYTDDQLTGEVFGYGTAAASVVSYCYDPDGDQTSVVYGDGNPSGTSVTYASGAISGLASCSTTAPWTVSAAPQASYQTTYSYDSAGELVSTATPANTVDTGGATTTSTYDAAGNMLTSKDPDGVTTTWTYTPLNLPATVSYSGSSAHAVTYSYDASANETGMTDATGASSYVYDPFEEVTSADNGAGKITTYGYSADGQVTGITYPLPSAASSWDNNNTTVSYGYDNADELTSVTDFNGHQITIGNTADGLPSSGTLGSTGDAIATTYDATDSPSTISLKNSSTTLQSFSYANSPAGTIQSETDTPSSSQSPAGYTYDAQGRVTSDTPGSGTAKDYAFDASGNQTTLPTGATVPNGGYNDAGELLQSILAGTTSRYTYNADGEQLASTSGSTATWDGAQQLATYSNSAASMTAATYDGNDMRASSTTTPSGGSAVTQNYVWSGDNLLMDSASAYIFTGGTAPAEQVNLASGAITYLVTDSLGSVRGIVNSSGALTGTTNYDAWGNPETTGGLTATTPFGYAGGYTDPDGLIYLLNRYYNPLEGQFISVDPDLSQTLQPYAYADGNPVMNTDSTGLVANVHPCCTGNPGKPGKPSKPSKPNPNPAPTPGVGAATIAERDNPRNWTFEYKWGSDFGQWHTAAHLNDTPDGKFNWYIGVEEAGCTVLKVDGCTISNVEWQTYVEHFIYYWTPVIQRQQPWGGYYWWDMVDDYWRVQYGIDFWFPPRYKTYYWDNIKGFIKNIYYNK